MKRSIKKTDKPAVKEQPESSFEDSAWLNEMRSALSPYWSARLEHTVERRASNPDEEEAA